MKFRNRVSGNVIDVPCAVYGPDWEPVKEEKPKKPRKQEPDEKEK